MVRVWLWVRWGIMIMDIVMRLEVCLFMKSFGLNPPPCYIHSPYQTMDSLAMYLTSRPQ